MKLLTKPKSIKLQYSFLYFVGGALLFLLTERLVLPFLQDAGVSYLGLFMMMALPHMIFFFVALLAFRIEGQPMTWEAFKSRFRYQPIRGKMWLWAILIIITNIGLYLAVYKLGYSVVKQVHDFFPTPEIITQVMGDGETFVGHAIKGNWWLLAVHFFYFFFNICGEEFLWRGYLFPRQELTHGKYTWIVHGLLWTIFHLFAPYNALLVLPGALFMAYVVQRTKNNTLFLLSHAVINGIPIVGLLLKIIG